MNDVTVAAFACPGYRLCLLAVTPLAVDDRLCRR